MFQFSTPLFSPGNSKASLSLISLLASTEINVLSKKNVKDSNFNFNILFLELKCNLFAK